MKTPRIIPLLATLLAAAAQAAPIPIVNHSFEDPVLTDGSFLFQTPGWTRTNTFCGAFNPSIAAFPAQAPDGQNVAFLDSVSQLRQITDAILQPNTTYTLTVDYGAQLSFAGLSPLIQIRAGGFAIASSNPALPPAAPGTFQTLTIIVSIGSEHFLRGQSIEVVLGTGTTGIQVDYDNIRLDASPDTFAPACVTPRQIINAPGPDDAFFGMGLAASDDTAAVFGGPDNALHFYHREGDAWVHTQTVNTPLTFSPEPLPMAIDGDTLIVSSPLQGGSATASGTVHVFHRAGGVWAFDESLNPAVPSFNDRFGSACDLQGDRILVGSPGADSGHGNAAVFRRSGNAWILEQTLVPAGPGNARFGAAVAIDGEYAFLGSQINTIAVFKRSGNTWTQIDSIQGAAATAFGSSLDADGGVLIVGALNENRPGDPGAFSQGAVYLYRLFNGQWLFEQRLTDPDPMHAERFGTAVRLSQGRAVVLIPNEDDFDGTFGSIAVYQRGILNWSLLQKVDRINADSSGPIPALALSGRNIIIADRVSDPLIPGAPQRLVYAIDLDAPAITQHPLDQSAKPGDAVTLSVQTSSMHATFQWRKNGVALVDGGGIGGALTNTVTINPAEATDTGNYDCIIGSLVGCPAVVSDSALVVVTGAAPPCPGDANTNGEVEFSDITFVLQNWGGMCP